MSDEQFQIPEFMLEVQRGVLALGEQIAALKADQSSLESLVVSNFDDVKQHLSDQDKQIAGLVEISKGSQEALLKLVEITEGHGQRLTTIEGRL